MIIDIIISKLNSIVSFLASVTAIYIYYLTLLFRTIINFKEPLYKDIFTFLLHGRRKDEVLSLTWDMIDLEKRVYYIGFEINKAKKI